MSAERQESMADVGEVAPFGCQAGEESKSAEIRDAARCATVKFECPRCQSQDLWKNGHNKSGSQQYVCRSCTKVFVPNPGKAPEVKLIADRLLIEGVGVPVISKVLDGFVSRRWIYNRRTSLQSRGVING